MARSQLLVRKLLDGKIDIPSWARIGDCMPGDGIGWSHGDGHVRRERQAAFGLCSSR